jgi:hypothetical protein
MAQDILSYEVMPLGPGAGPLLPGPARRRPLAELRGSVLRFDDPFAPVGDHRPLAPRLRASRR